MDAPALGKGYPGQQQRADSASEASCKEASWKDSEASLWEASPWDKGASWKDSDNDSVASLWEASLRDKGAFCKDLKANWYKDFKTGSMFLDRILRRLYVSPAGHNYLPALR